MKMSFIGIGAQKCASTWISNVLRSHPDIAMPEQEPLDFFSYSYENGYRWYESQIDPDAPSGCRGGMSQSYFHELPVIDRVKEYQDYIDSEFKIVVSLRNPIERALSQHRHLVRLGRVPAEDLSFEAALRTNPTYQDQGMYYSHLSRWIASFGKERIHVVLMEDIREDPLKVAKALYRFLEVSEDSVPTDLHKSRNQSYVPRSRQVDAVRVNVSRTMRALGAQGLWRTVGNLGLRNLYRRFNHHSSSQVIPDPNPETLIELRSNFAEDVRQLSHLLGRDLTAWLS